MLLQCNLADSNNCPDMTIFYLVTFSEVFRMHIAHSLFEGLHQLWSELGLVLFAKGCQELLLLFPAQFDALSGWEEQMYHGTKIMLVRHRF